MLYPWTVVTVAAVVTVQTWAVLYDTYTGLPVGPNREAELRAKNLIPWCAIDVAPCNPAERRRMDYSCNNLKRPSRGTNVTPYHRMLAARHAANGGLKTAASGRPLPNARALRLALMSDGRVPGQRYSHMMTHMLVFVTGDVTSVHDTVNYVVMTRSCCAPGGESDPRCMPIAVADDDVHLRASPVRCLNLTRAITYQRLGCVPNTLPPERINQSPPMLELSAMYGSNIEKVMNSRTRRGGLLRGETLNSDGTGQEWFPQGSVLCLGNQPPQETRCHNGANVLTNALLGGNLFSLWFFRSHNRLARRLAAINPCWEDDQLFYTARDINIAYYQHTLYYELMVPLLGHEFLLRNKVIYDTAGHVNDYDETQEPRVSIEYVIASRWFHTIQEGRQKMYTKTGKLYDEIASVDMTLRTGALAVNNTIQGLTQGSFRQPTAADDYVVDPDIGERILGPLQLASDVVSSDVMKDRDAGLPPYNHYRRLCGLPPIRSFKDLYQWMPTDQAEALFTMYEDVEDIELLAGILAERKMDGANVGPTLACVMVDQLRRWRQADRYWYENSVHPGAFTDDQLMEIRRFSLASLLCQNGDDVDEIQPQAYLVPGPGNEITKCSNIYTPSVEPWRDQFCVYNITKNSEKLHENQYNFGNYQGHINTGDFPANPLQHSIEQILNPVSMHPQAGRVWELNPNAGVISTHFPDIFKTNPYTAIEDADRYRTDDGIIDIGKDNKSPTLGTPKLMPELNNLHDRSVLGEH